jgi:small GTP-binding protein
MVSNTVAGKDYDVLLKIVLIGDSGVGKTSLLQRFSDQFFNENHITTIGVDFKLRTIQLGDTRVKLQVWDTAGQEKFRVITKAYYRNAAGIIIGYDITNGESFVNTKRWINEVKSNCGDDGVPIILIGNKCDAPNRVVSLQDQQEYSQLINIPFFETSAKQNINVDEAFTELTRLILERQKRLNQLNANNTNNTNNDNAAFKIDSKQKNSKSKKQCC